MSHSGGSSRPTRRRSRAATPGPGRLQALPELVEHIHALGWDVVEMVLADQDSWDRYVAAQWLTVQRWLEDNPADELADRMRADLAASQLHHTRYQRDFLGWGVVALMRRKNPTWAKIAL